MNKFSLYLHYPYCRRVCPFCDFVVQKKAQGETAKTHDQLYFAALHAELELAKADFSNMTLQTIYFGGGTPSLAPIAALDKLLQQIQQTFRSDVQEITLEVDPSTVSLAKIKELRRLGISRFSLGIQSFDDRLLHTLGRGYDRQAALDLIEMCDQAQIPRLSADLIYGVAGQTLKDWQVDLATMSTFTHIQHLSLYNLMIPADQRYRRRIAKLKQEQPSESTEVAMHQLAMTYLATQGYKQYEISTWARRGEESLHNQGYWCDRPYLGLGVSAHSYLKPKRWSNRTKLHDYLNAVMAGQNPIGQQEILSQAQLRSEWWMLRLRRLQGIARDEIAQLATPIYQPIIERFVKSGHLQWQDDHLRLTPAGMMVSNEIFSEFCLTSESSD